MILIMVSVLWLKGKIGVVSKTKKLLLSKTSRRASRLKLYLQMKILPVN